VNHGYPARIGRCEFVYLTPDSDVDASSAAPVGYDFFEDIELRRHPRFRRVLIPLIRSFPPYYGMLHWSDGMPLGPGQLNPVG
jgi:hypothetical protein